VAVSEPDAAARAAGEALERGDRFLVAVGGDELINGVVNGMLDGGRPVVEGAVLGVVVGSARSDFIRTFGLPADPPRACAHLQGEELFSIDAAVVRYRTGDGSPGERHFVNMAQAGLGGAVAARTARLPARLGRVGRFGGFWLGVATFRPTEILLRGDRRTWEGRAHDVLVANGQYGGDGYRLSPRSWPSDGYLDVLVMTGPKSDSFTVLPKAVLGEHLPHRNIIEYRARTLSIESRRSLPLQADGRFLGTTPAGFEVLPGAIRLKV
jgi:diacylglycerol kinase (ATP)